MQRIKKITAIILTMLTLSSVCVAGSVFSASAGSTGAGLAEWALNAYYSGWSYVYGGSTPGAVDCSGLIYSYCGGDRTGDAQLGSATESGSVSAGIPRVHGLGLYMPGHVGVYVGDGMEVDARGDDYGVCYQSVESSYMGWSYWFKLSACSYVTNGWEQFNGNYYYYEDGQYIVDTSRNIDGTTYYFDSQGRSSQTPSNMSSTTSSGSSSSGSSSSSSSGSATQSCWSNGSSGDEVTKIQERLTELGFYTGEISGYFDDATESAYKAFQQAAGLVVDGIAGSDREVLYSDDAPVAVSSSEEPTTDTENTEETNSDKNVFKNGDESDAVYEIQEKLAKLGYFDIDATGFFGDYTEQAVKNFQLENALEATGIVDEETYAVLFGDSAVSNPAKTQTSDAAVQAAPVEMPVSTSPSQFILSNQTNQAYTDTASEVAVKTNKVTNKALSKSAPVIASATATAARRTANVGLWLALVAVILGAVAFVFFLRDRKASRYTRYCAKKKKRVTKAELSARW